MPFFAVFDVGVVWKSPAFLLILLKFLGVVEVTPPSISNMSPPLAPALGVAAMALLGAA